MSLRDLSVFSPHNVFTVSVLPSVHKGGGVTSKLAWVFPPLSTDESLLSILSILDEKVTLHTCTVVL